MGTGFTYQPIPGGFRGGISLGANAAPPVDSGVVKPNDGLPPGYFVDPSIGAPRGPGDHENQLATGPDGKDYVWRNGAWSPVAPSVAPPPSSWHGSAAPSPTVTPNLHMSPGWIGGPAPTQPGFLPAAGTPGALKPPVPFENRAGLPVTPNPGYLPARDQPGGANMQADKFYNPPPAAPPPAVPGATAPGSMTPGMQGMIDKYAAGRSTPAIAPTTVGAAGVATAGTSTAPTVGTTTLDRTQDNQTREQQQQSISDLFAASRGLTPSAAELQSRQALDRNMANQYALAAALQGRSAGGALKQASDATGALNAQGAADAAVLRAKEQESARAALSSMLLGVRNTDVTAENAQGLLTSAANLKQADVTGATGIANAGNETTASTTNANNQTSLVKTQAEIDADKAKNDVVNTLKARGLDDEQIGRFLTAMTTGRGQDITAATAARGQDITARGQDMQAQADAARDATARQLGIAKLDLERSLADWAKTKDVTTLAGSLLAAGASNDAVQKFIKGLGGGSTGDGGDYGYSGVDGGPGEPNAATDPNGTVSGNGNYGPESSDNPEGTG
jgi:hypothetical protein